MRNVDQRWWLPQPGREPGLYAWLALPELENPIEAERFWPLVSEAVELFARWAPNELTVRTSEPRQYLVRSGAWLRVQELLATGLLRNLALDAGDYEIAEFWLWLGDPDRRNSRVDIDLKASFALQAAIPGAETGNIVELVKRWATTYGASQGCISVRPESSIAASLERGEDLNSIPSWTGTQKFLRCLAWGTYLGPELCSRLGGVDQVLRTAPVWRAQPLGPGVFLEMSPDIREPAPDERWEQGIAYLRPLFATSPDGIPYTYPERPPPPPTPDIGPGTGRRGRRVVPSFPVEIVDQGGVDATFNLYFRSRPSPAVVEQLQQALRAWYTAGVRGAFGEPGLHDMTRPVPNGRAVRWHVDFGTVDERRAMRELASRLEELARQVAAPIERLVVGEELVE